ncbi:MAG TPA: cytochrome c [Candidatus Acidoferrales bacterium]|nr:cytochrome c [Candidatus Acidoferrales bacterium]
MGRPFLGFLIGILVAPALAALVAFSGHFPFQATAAPPRWERRIANLALDPAIERAASGVSCPIAATDENLIQGMKLYRENCVLCHGDRGKPSAWGRNNFYPPAPQLADRGSHDPVPVIYTVVKNGIRYTGMGGWKDQGPDDDLWRVALFLSRIKSLPPAVDSMWKAGTR